MKTELFGMTNRGEQVTRYTMTNHNGMEVSVIDLGATIVNILVPAASGRIKDVVLGYDAVEDYQKNTCYFGACIGRSSNRIAKAKCVIDGVEYALEPNDNGNHLHSGAAGVHDMMFKADVLNENAVAMTVISPDMSQGMPGNLTITVTYTLTEDNELVLEYRANTDKATVVNLTNHTYFNLDGHDSGSILEHKVLLAAEKYTPVIDSESIPTGEIAAVAGTPMDFTSFKTIGEEIEADFDQLKYGAGYDHNYMVDGESGTLRLAAKAKSAKSGIRMEAYTDLPAVQFYVGNFISTHTGKGGAVYNRRQGFCLETQFVPDAVNQPVFESPVLQPEDTFVSKTVYRFHA